MKGRPHAPKGAQWEAAMSWWKTLFTDEGAHFDKIVTIRGEDIAPDPVVGKYGNRPSYVGQWSADEAPIAGQITAGRRIRWYRRRLVCLWRRSCSH